MLVKWVLLPVIHELFYIHYLVILLYTQSYNFLFKSSGRLLLVPRLFIFSILCILFVIALLMTWGN